MEEWFLEKYSIIHYSLKAERLSLRKANIVGMLLNLLDVLLVSGGGEDEGGKHDADGGGGGLHHGDRLGTLKGASDSNLALNTEAKKPQKEGGMSNSFLACPGNASAVSGIVGCRSAQAVCHSE